MFVTIIYSDFFAVAKFIEITPEINTINVYSPCLIYSVDYVRSTSQSLIGTIKPATS